MGLLKIRNTSANIGEYELKAENVRIDFELTSGSQYESLTAGDGKRKYNLQKGPYVKFVKEEQKKIVVTVIDVPGGKNKDNIEKLRGHLEDTRKNEDHAESVTICFFNHAKKQAFSMIFSGCVSEVKDMPVSGVEANKYEVTLFIRDMATLNFDK